MSVYIVVFITSYIILLQITNQPYTSDLVVEIFECRNFRGYQNSQKLLPNKPARYQKRKVLKESMHESKIEFEIVPTEVDSRHFHYIHLENNYFQNACL